MDTMRLNDDFSQPVDIPFAEAVWIASPLNGVDRHMLDRIGDENARATTIVRYARDSHFSTHVHDEGEEFVVLEGTFSDASGDFGPGTYVRNPPGSDHAPWSDDGTIIFVKLRQFDPGDTARVVIDPGTAAWSSAGTPGVSTLPLHSFEPEVCHPHPLQPRCSSARSALPARCRNSGRRGRGDDRRNSLCQVGLATATGRRNARFCQQCRKHDLPQDGAFGPITPHNKRFARLQLRRQITIV